MLLLAVAGLRNTLAALDCSRLLYPVRKAGGRVGDCMAARTVRRTGLQDVFPLPLLMGFMCQRCLQRLCRSAWLLHTDISLLADLFAPPNW